MITISQIQETYNQIKPFLEDERVKRYGSILLKTSAKGAKKIIGHLEATKKARNSAMFSSSGVGGITSQLAGNLSGSAQQLLAGSGSAVLGGLTSLGWANLALTGVSIGVTVASTVILSKKIDHLSQEVQRMNGKLDGIMSEMHQIKAMVGQLNDNEIRKLYSEANRQIRRMKGYTSELSIGRYNDHLRREVQNQLLDASVFLEDLLGRYTDANCGIALGLDIIMAHFYTFISLMKTYISTVYLYDKDLLHYEEYEESLRNLCSKSMIESVQDAYRQSSSSFISPQDIGLITSVYKGILVEQISEIKSQRQILELVDYQEYRRINEQLQDSSASGELVLIQYSA